MVVSLRHRDLVLRVQRQLTVTAFQFGHEGRRQRRFALGRLRHRGVVGLALWQVLLRVARIASVQTADLLAARVVHLMVCRWHEEFGAAHHVLLFLLHVQVDGARADAQRAVRCALIRVVVQAGLVEVFRGLVAALAVIVRHRQATVRRTLTSWSR